VHHRRSRIVGIFAGLAGAVFAAQDAGDVAPLREILADGRLLRVIDDDAPRVGDIDAEIDAFLVHAGNVGLRAAPDGGTHRVGKRAVVDAPGGKFERGHLGQHMGGIDQGFLGGLADARLGFAVDGVEDEPRREADDQEVAEEEADGNVHVWLRRRP